MNIERYIAENLPKTVRFLPNDNGDLIGLPRPFIVPCASGMFQEMYYWDSYFTSRGLIVDGNVEQAKNNVENLCSLVRRFGFVLNGSNRVYLNNSQPPFLSQMAREVYEVTGDEEWLASVYPDIAKEHSFWMNSRTDESGLAHYDVVYPLPDWQLKRGRDIIVNRLGLIPDKSDAELARALFAVGESGWDISPRFTHRTYEIIPVDLNALLYSLENNLSYFASVLGKDDESLTWARLRDERLERCRNMLLAEDGVYYDYDTRRGEINKLASAACFYPLYFGMASKEEAEKTVKAILPLLETDWGIVTSVPSQEQGNFQWGYPNGWSPLQQITVGALLRYGYVDDAKRIARKFVALIEKCFDETGHLWEKYNVVDGNCNVTVEYETPAMLGWTYGAYREFKHLIAE